MSTFQLVGMSSIEKKKQNWETLQRAVLNKIDVKLNEQIIDKIVKQEEGVIEAVLHNIKQKIV